ncbi:unnamed protein product [Gongylonema pulchrum]|uniref:Transmembrane protein n=1 Tax=Gongylonema pulchrum TaxID=637853 RepID=A0A183DHT8_9BILA|nr:unnamed protein product [Gongylonema pulchrum]
MFNVPILSLAFVLNVARICDTHSGYGHLFHGTKQRVSPASLAFSIKKPARTRSIGDFEYGTTGIKEPTTHATKVKRKLNPIIERHPEMMEVRVKASDVVIIGLVLLLMLLLSVFFVLVIICP